MTEIIDIVEPYITGPQGPGGTIESATAVGLAPGAEPTVTLGGTPEQRTIEFGIPEGEQGTPATITSATAETLPPQSAATVTVGGTPSARTFKFGIPKGDPGSGSVNSVNGDFGPDVVLAAEDVGAVSSVNGKTGTSITLTPADVGSAPAAAVDTLSGRIDVVASSSVRHKSKVYAGALIDIFTLNTGGEHVPGLVTKRLAAGTPTPTLGQFRTPRQFAEDYGDLFVSNGSGWDASTGAVRGPNLIDGVAHGVLASGGSSQDRAAIAYCSDGQLRYYEATLGHSVATMLADGALHSWSWGPQIILNDAVFNYAASGGWGGLGTTVKSGRTVLGQRTNGDIVLAQVYGISGTSGLTVGETATALLGEELRMAVLLDGGGSASSAWQGNVAHPSTDTVSRPLPDVIAFNAPAANMIRYPATDVALDAPFSGQTIAISREGDEAYMTAVLRGSRTTAGVGFIVPAARMPLWLKTLKVSKLFSASMGKTGIIGLNGGSLRIGSGYSDGFSNPDIAISLPAFIGFD